MRTILAAALLAALTTPAAAQSITERSPNLSGPWVAPSGVIQFNFLHRFSAGAPPQRKVSNYPTFLLAAGLPAHLFAGVQYATNSQVAARIPNEWEFFVRAMPLSEERGPIDAAVEAAWNHAAESFDGELSLARTIGPVRLIAAGRALSHAYGVEQVRFAAAGGAVLRLNRWFALAGDVAKLLDTGDEAIAGLVASDVAWGAGVQIAIPYTPHSLSLQASNANTATLEGSSRASGATRYGFEFTIPVTLSRWFGVGRTAGASASAASVSGSVARASMRAMTYTVKRLTITPGTTVEWKNSDQVAHTVTADDGSFDSGVIEPGATWRHTFASAGEFAFHCTPHPFMKGVVVVH